MEIYYADSRGDFHSWGDLIRCKKRFDLTRVICSRRLESTRNSTEELECYNSRLQSRLDYSTINKITSMKKMFSLGKFDFLKLVVAVRNRYTSRFTAASIWEILSLIVLLTRDPRRTSTHQLAEHEDCIKGEQKILLTN